MKGKLQLLPRQLKKRRKIDYGVELLFAIQEPLDMVDLVSGPKLIPHLKGTLKCLGDPFLGPPTENTPSPS